MRVALSLFLLLLSVFSGWASETRDDAAKVIARIPSEAELDQLRQQADFGKSKEEKQKAKQTLRSAIEDFRKLRSLLQPGTRISDYPGLLTLPRSGTPSHDSTKHLHILPLGTFMTEPGDPEQCFFRVIYDEEGTIREVKGFMLLF